VKSVATDNLVVAGNTAPFFDNTPSVTAVDPDWGPLSFMRDFLCLGPGLKPTCSERAGFDVWSTNPYGSGGPVHRAALPNDVSIPELPAMQAVLSAATQAGHIDAPQSPSFWVTEFSWDSNPPDPKGVPEPLLSRWSSEALYRMWQSGVSLVSWFLIRDEPLGQSPYQSGLYFAGDTLAADTPKPMLQAFNFPFVAVARRQLLTVWGRTPGERPATVAVEQAFSGGWTELGRVATDSNGIVQAAFTTTSRAAVRARTIDLNEASVPYSLETVPDRSFTPFGGFPLEPSPSANLVPALPAARSGPRDRIAVQKALP